MTDPAHQKFAALMAEIEDLEEKVAGMQVRVEGAGSEPALAGQLRETQQLLADKRTELRRISDGCGKPRMA